MMIKWENQSAVRKTCPCATLSTMYPADCPGLGRCSGELMS